MLLNGSNVQLLLVLTSLKYVASGKEGLLADLTLSKWVHLKTWATSSMQSLTSVLDKIASYIDFVQGMKTMRKSLQVVDTKSVGYFVEPTVVVTQILSSALW